MLAERAPGGTGQQVLASCAGGRRLDRTARIAQCPLAIVQFHQDLRTQREVAVVPRLEAQRLRHPAQRAPAIALRIHAASRTRHVAGIGGLQRRGNRARHDLGPGVGEIRLIADRYGRQRQQRRVLRDTRGDQPRSRAHRLLRTAPARFGLRDDLFQNEVGLRIDPEALCCRPALQLVGTHPADRRQLFARRRQPLLLLERLGQQRHRALEQRAHPLQLLARCFRRPLSAACPPTLARVNIPQRHFREGAVRRLFQPASGNTLGLGIGIEDRVSDEDLIALGRVRVVRPQQRIETTVQGAGSLRLIELLVDLVQRQDRRPQQQATRRPRIRRPGIAGQVRVGEATRFRVERLRLDRAHPGQMVLECGRWRGRRLRHVGLRPYEPHHRGPLEHAFVAAIRQRRRLPHSGQQRVASLRIEPARRLRSGGEDLAAGEQREPDGTHLPGAYARRYVPARHDRFLQRGRVGHGRIHGEGRRRRPALGHRRHDPEHRHHKGARAPAYSLPARHARPLSMSPQARYRKAGAG